MTYPNSRKGKGNMDDIPKFEGGKKVSINLCWTKTGLPSQI